jgi:predicted ATP-grasp superfamily ATP-dependent carboligase
MTEDWLEKADEEDNIKFIDGLKYKSNKKTIVLEILGHYGSVGQIIAREIQRIGKEKKKIAGIFSNYFSEMIQMSFDEILMPVTVFQMIIGNVPYIISTSNFMIPDVIGYQLSEELYNFYKKSNVSKILLIDGAYSTQRQIDKQPKVCKISSENYQINMLTEKMVDFTIMGQIACSFLTYWQYNTEIPLDIVVAESFSDYDPISSLELLKVLTQELGIQRDFNELEQKSQDFFVHYQNLGRNHLREKDNSLSSGDFFI